MKSSVTTVLVILVVLFLFTASSCRSLLPTDPDQESSAPVALAAGHPTGPRPEIYIVLTSEPPNNKEDKNHFYLRILARVFGSEEAAKNALVYTYTHAITGFSAILTPRQLAKLSEQPEVLSVFKNGAVDIDQAVSAQAPLAGDLTGSALYIVLTSDPPKQEDRNQFYLRILTRVFDSDDAAKNALVISYKNVITGFAAKLTPDQVSTLLEQPEVLTVIKDEAF